MNKHTGEVHKPEYSIYEEAILPKKDDLAQVLTSVTTLECTHDSCAFILRDEEIIEYIERLEDKLERALDLIDSATRCIELRPVQETMQRKRDKLEST